MENLNKPHTAIKNWDSNDRPREKMIKQGAQSLSPAELLALLINNGTTKKSALDLARELLAKCDNSLAQLTRLSLKELQAIKGIGPAKAVVIKAAMEISIRKDAESFERLAVNSSGDVARYLQKRLQNENREHFWVIYLNQGNRIITSEVASSGGITGTHVDTRLIVRKALEVHATQIILCHNHPSGLLKPSLADKALTQKIRDAAILFDIKVTDHLIVSNEGYYSFADEGEL